MQGNESIQIKPRRKRRSPEQIAELVREFGGSGLRQRQFCEERGIALSELQRSLKITRRAKSTPKLLAVEVEADEQSAEGLELLVGEAYRIRIGAGFCAVTLRRPLTKISRNSFTTPLGRQY
jgi:hypothetical protein